MNSTGMMYSVTFRPLDDIAQPNRCFNIRVLEDPQEVSYKQRNSDGLGCEPGDNRKTHRAQRCPANHIKWTKIKSPIGVKSLGTVVHLVKNFPEPFTVVHGAMPYIHSKFI